MTQQHPITPPPELVRQWASESLATQNLCTRAAQWGADQELEACIAWFDRHIPGYELVADRLRSARRPTQSLKEQALALINHDPANQPFLSDKGIDIIRRALEQLDD